MFLNNDHNKKCLNFKTKTKTKTESICFYSNWHRQFFVVSLFLSKNFFFNISIHVKRSNKHIFWMRAIFWFPVTKSLTILRNWNCLCPLLIVIVDGSCFRHANLHVTRCKIINYHWEKCLAKIALAKSWFELPLARIFEQTLACFYLT